MVDDAIAHRCLVDNTMLRVENMKAVIGAVTVGSGRKIVVKGEYVVFEVTREELDIGAIVFAARKCSPGEKKIIKRGNIIKHMHDIQELPLFKNTFDMLSQFHILRNKMPKASRYTLGGRIEDELLALLIDIMEAGRTAKALKNPMIDRALHKNDTLKVLFRLAENTKAVSTKAHDDFQISLQRTGSMLGGWRRSSG